MAPPYYSPYSASEVVNILLPRQTTVSSTPSSSTSSSCSGVSGGAVAGIVIGTIVATLLLVWAFSQRTAAGGATQQTKTTVIRDEHPRKRRRRSRSHSHSGASRVNRPERVYYTEK